MFSIVFDIAVSGHLNPQLLSQLNGRGISDGNEHAIGFKGGRFICFIVDNKNFLNPFFSSDLFNFRIPEHRYVVVRKLFHQEILGPQFIPPMDQGDINAHVKKMQGFSHRAVTTAYHDHFFPFKQGAVTGTAVADTSS